MYIGNAHSPVWGGGAIVLIPQDTTVLDFNSQYHVKMLGLLTRILRKGYIYNLQCRRVKNSNFFNCFPLLPLDGIIMLFCFPPSHPDNAASDPNLVSLVSIWNAVPKYLANTSLMWRPLTFHDFLHKI
jgi:hypothetical protein